MGTWLNGHASLLSFQTQEEQTVLDTIGNLLIHKQSRTQSLDQGI